MSILNQETLRNSWDPDSVLARALSVKWSVVKKVDMQWNNFPELFELLYKIAEAFNTDPYYSENPEECSALLRDKVFNSWKDGLDSVFLQMFTTNRNQLNPYFSSVLEKLKHEQEERKKK